MACLGEGAVAWLVKNNQDYFYVDFLLPHPLEYPLEETLGGKCTAHHAYMNKIVRSETYVHFSHDHHY